MKRRLELRAASVKVSLLLLLLLPQPLSLSVWPVCPLITSAETGNNLSRGSGSRSFCRSIRQHSIKSSTGAQNKTPCR
jgi:hypothetical protein